MIILPLTLLLAVSIPFVVAAWLATRKRPNQSIRPDFGADAIACGLPTSFDAADTHDAERMVRAAAWAEGQLADSRFVRLEMAVSPGIRTRVCPIALRDALRTTVRNAIGDTRGGQVLITAMASADELRITVTDDGPDTDLASRACLARVAAALIEPHGGSIDVEINPGEGTTVSLRLPPVHGYPPEYDHSHEWAEQAA
jgi:hypothetical protein